MISPIQIAAEAISKIIATSPSQRVLGAKLGAQLRVADPGFTPVAFQCRNLRQFIKSHVPAIEEKGRSGPDFIYGPASVKAQPDPVNQSQVAFVTAPTTAFNWRAFSSPSYPFHLIANRDTGEFEASAIGAELVPPWIVIRKPTTEEHLAIARAFVDSLHENLREPLNRVLSEPKWFLRFSPTARGFGLGAAWAAFRTARLKDIFENEMKSLGIPERKPSPRVDTNLFLLGRCAQDRSGGLAAEPSQHTRKLGLFH
jgi:hypothetical protein